MSGPDEAARIRREYARREQEQRQRGWYRYSQPGHLLLVQERERRLLALLTRQGLAERLSEFRALDVGCGAGDLLLDLVRYGARADHLAGIDLLPERVAAAQARLPAADIRCADAAGLPYAPDSFDLVCQLTMFSSVLDAAARRRIAAELARVTRPGGLIVWYDLARDNPRNPAVRGIGRAELASLFPGCRIEAEALTLAAPLARRVAPHSWLLADLLARLPPLRTHLLAAIRPADSR